MTYKRIWLVTELFYPEETAVAYIFTRIANHLSKSYKVSVICGPEYYDSNKDKFVDDIHVSKAIEIHRIKSLDLDKNLLFQRSIKLIILSLRIGSMMFRKISKGETVILSTNPAPLLIVARVIKYFKNFQLHILVHDVFPENTIPAKIFKNNKVVIFRILKYFFDKAYSCADHLIVIGRDMKEIISTKVNGSKTFPVISVVTNWSNPEKFKLIARKFDPNRIILQYAGNLGRVQGLEEILKAFRLSNNKNLCFNIRGSGALYSVIENIIKNSNSGNINLNGSFSRNDENEILADCDIGIVSLVDGMFGLGVPSKSYHLLSAGKPILYIGVPETEISCMVLENEIGWSLDIRNQIGMIEFFKNLSSIDSNTLMFMGQKARLLAENKYSEIRVLELLQLKIESVKTIGKN